MLLPAASDGVVVLPASTISAVPPVPLPEAALLLSDAPPWPIADTSISVARIDPPFITIEALPPTPSPPPSYPSPPRPSALTVIDPALSNVLPLLPPLIAPPFSTRLADPPAPGEPFCCSTSCPVVEKPWPLASIVSPPASARVPADPIVSVAVPGCWLLNSGSVKPKLSSDRLPPTVAVRPGPIVIVASNSPRSDALPANVISAWLASTSRWLAIAVTLLEKVAPAMLIVPAPSSVVGCVIWPPDMLAPPPASRIVPSESVVADWAVS